MKKPVYKLLDEKGRILIPKEFRQMVELESGDIVKLSVSSGKIMVSVMYFGKPLYDRLCLHIKRLLLPDMKPYRFEG